MQLLKHRPLATACLFLVFSLGLAFYITSRALLAFLIIAAVLLALILFLYCRARTYWRLLLLLLALGALLGAGRVFGARVRTAQLFEERIGSKVTAECEVLEIRTQSAYQTEYLIRISCLDTLGCYTTAVVRTEGAAVFYPGDRIKGQFVCRDLTWENYYKGQDKSYLADGANMILAVEDTEALHLLESGHGSLRATAADLRNRLHHRITAAVKGESGELISALLLGTSGRLGDDTVRNFRRTGVSHLLAISGLHLSVLVAFLDRLLLLLRVRRKPRMILLSVFCTAYFVLTGCSFSMLRSLLMLLVAYLSFFAKGDKDSFTSLCFAAAVILLWTPGALFSLSFQMTMLATLGILAFGEIQELLHRILRPQRGARGLLLRVMRGVTASLLLTLSATLALLPVQWLVFGEISALTPLSNLVLVPLTTLILILGLMILPLATLLSPLLLLSALLDWLSRITLYLASRGARLPCMISLRAAFVPYIFIPMFALTVLLLLIDLNHKKPLVFAPALIAMIAFVICQSATFSAGVKQVEIIYRHGETGEGVLLIQNDRAVIFDVSAGSQAQLSADFKALQESGATEVECLILSHYHSKTAIALSRFADKVLLREVLLPRANSEAEREIFEDLQRVADQKGILLTQYEAGERIVALEGTTLFISAPLYEDRSVEPALRMDVFAFGTHIRYESAAYSEYVENAGLSVSRIPADVLIIGAHGPRPHEAIVPVPMGTPREVWVGHKDFEQNHTPIDGAAYYYLPGEKRLILH